MLGGFAFFSAFQKSKTKKDPLLMKKASSYRTKVPPILMGTGLPESTKRPDASGQFTH